jgi:hypothetical protein
MKESDSDGKMEAEVVARLNARFDAMDQKWHRFMEATVKRYPGADHVQVDDHWKGP